MVVYLTYPWLALEKSTPAEMDIPDMKLAKRAGALGAVGEGGGA